MLSRNTGGQGSKIAYFLAGPVGPVVRISAIPTSHDAVPTKICQTRQAFINYVHASCERARNHHANIL